MLTGAAILVAAATVLVPASPALAVPGLIVTIDWSDDTASESFKTANAVCPTGTVILGGGADIVNGAGEVRLVSLIPGALGLPTHSYYGVAVEGVGGYSGNWTMYAWAICGSGVSGWQKVSNTATSTGTQDLIGVTAACPANKKVIGTGANVQGNVVFTFLDTVQPSPSLANVYVEAARDEIATTETITVTSHAICINPVGGQQLVSASTASDSVGAKYLSVKCPAGTKLHGTGGSITGALGEAFFDRIGLFGLGAVEGSDVEVREDEPEQMKIGGIT